MRGFRGFGRFGPTPCRYFASILDIQVDHSLIDISKFLYGEICFVLGSKRSCLLKFGNPVMYMTLYTNKDFQNCRRHLFSKDPTFGSWHDHLDLSLEILKQHVSPTPLAMSFGMDDDEKQPRTPIYSN